MNIIPVVNNDAEFRNLMKVVLTRIGYKTFETEDGATTIEFAGALISDIIIGEVKKDRIRFHDVYISQVHDTIEQFRKLSEQLTCFFRDWKAEHPSK